MFFIFFGREERETRQKEGKRRPYPFYALSLTEEWECFLFKLVSDEKLVLFKENQP